VWVIGAVGRQTGWVALEIAEIHRFGHGKPIESFDPHLAVI